MNKMSLIKEKILKLLVIIDEESIKNLKKFLYIVWHRYRRQWEFALVIVLLSAILKLPMPLLTKYVIDKLIANQNIHMLVYICLMILIITVIYLLIDAYKDYLLFKVRSALSIRYNMMLLRHIQKLSNQFLFKNQTGYLSARIMSDPNHLSTIFIDTTLTLIQSILVFIVCLGAIFYLHWKLSLLIVIVLPFYVLSHILFINKIKYWNEKGKEQNAIIFKNLKETLSAIPTVKLFLLEPYELLKFHKNLRKNFDYNLQEYKLNLMVSIIVSFFSALVPLLILGYGGYEIIKGSFTIGGLIAFNSLLGYLFSPVRAILNVHINFQTSLVSLNRIYKILKVEEFDNKFKTDTKQVPDNYSIRFVHVTFYYEKENTILEDISFDIKENQKIAIVGEVGAGKSTVINLLNRHIVPAHGNIYIGNINITKLDRKCLSSAIGVVSQDIFLFSSSILDNIRIGNLHASDEEIHDIVKKCHLDSFIQRLPEKYDTLVGENGVFLSGGQKQLISIARVLLRSPKIIILDEPTSSIDQHTEELIKEVLSQYFNDCTMIIISHKKKIIENVDKTFLVKDKSLSLIYSDSYEQA